MKKTLSLSLLMPAILLLTMVIACDNNRSRSSIETIKDVTIDVRKNGNNWDTNQMKEVVKKVLEAGIEFFQSSPDEMDENEFNKAWDDFHAALADLEWLQRELAMKVIVSDEMCELSDKFNEVRSKAHKDMEEK